MNSFFILGIILGLIITGYYVLRTKKNAKLYGPFAMYRTQRGITFIDNLAKTCPRFWRAFYTFGFIAGFFFMANLVYALTRNSLNIVKTPHAAQGAMLAIPGITIPLWGGLIGIIVLAVAHEFSHGIASRIENIKIKSVGTLSAGFLPLGAFVEPDEGHIKRSSTSIQLRIFGAGSFMNIVLAIAVLALLIFAVLPTFTQTMEGIKIIEVEKGSPAEKAGIEKGMIINAIEKSRMENLLSFVEYLNKRDIKPGEEIKLTTSEQTYSIKTVDKNGRGYMGVSICGQIPEKELFKYFFAQPLVINSVNPECYVVSHRIPSGAFWFVYGILVWIIVLNFGVGLVNLLPLKPLDGGLMVESVLSKLLKSEQSVKYIVVAVSLFSLLLLLVNLVGPALWKFLI